MLRLGHKSNNFECGNRRRIFWNLKWTVWSFQSCGSSRKIEKILIGVQLFNTSNCSISYIYISILEVTERLSSSRGKYMGMNNSDTHTCTYAKSKIELFLSFRTNENSIRKNSSIWLCSLFHSHWLLRDGRYCSRTHKKNIPYSNYL